MPGTSAAAMPTWPGRYARGAWVAGCGAFLLGMLGLVLLTGALSRDLLRGHALAVAENWAADLNRRVPGLGAVLRHEHPDAAALQDLSQLGAAAGVTQMLLLDVAGRPVLDAGDAVPAGPGPGGLPAAAAVRLAAGGAALAEVTLPLQAADGTPGAVVLGLDLGPLAARHARARLWLCLAAAVPALLLLGLGLHPRAAPAERHPRHDRLVGLGDVDAFRAALAEGLAGAVAERPPAVITLELDGLEAIRDTHGPEHAAALLREAARRLVTTARTDDVLARLGGAQFGVLQREGVQPEAAARFAARLLRELARPYALQNRPLICGAVAGIAVAGPDSDAAALLAQSELALRRARMDGQGTARFFEPGMDAAVSARLALEGALRQAAAAEDFTLHYQPVFEVRTRRLLGFEALLRWRHPERGPVSPAEFVPVLEETGLIQPVGAWVLRTACREAARWPGPIGVAVNLSPLQFRRGEVLEAVQAALAESGLAPGRLTLEITEGLLLEHTEAVLRTLAQLRDLGVSIALDDFGSGYSSLAYLWRFRFDILKIDRAFVQELRQDGKAAAIIESIVGLGHSLELRITAEGVETEEQLAALSGVGCDEAQGFLLGRPMPAAQAAALAESAGEPVPKVAA